MSTPLHEIVVGITDYLLALECGFFAWLLRPRGADRVAALFAAFFGVTALASLTGGTSHLFFPDATSLASDLLWKATVLALGGTAFAAWSAGASLLFTQPLQGRIARLAAAEFALYAIYVVAIDDRYRVAIANYIPAALFLGLAFALRYRAQRTRPALAGLAGLALTAIAALMQRMGAEVHPLYFNHNATYHLVQGIAFFLIFVAAAYFRGRA